MNSPESTLERDLRAIDEALEGAPRDPRPEVAALQDLAVALSADAPRPDAEFSELLRERAKAGFPARDGSLRTRIARLRPPRLQGLAPALGFAGLLLVALCVAVVALPNGNSGSRQRRRRRREQRGLLGRRRRGGVSGPRRAAEPRSRLGRGEGRAGCTGRRRGPVLPVRPRAARRLRARAQRSQDRALGVAGAGHARRPDGAPRRAGDRCDQPLRRLRAQLLAQHRRGQRGRRVRPADPRRPAARPRCAISPAWPRCARRASPAATSRGST